MSGAIVVTGAGAVTPLGSSPTRWSRPAHAAATPVGGGLGEIALDALPDVVRTRALRAERITRLALTAVGSALAASGLVAVDGPPRPHLGVVLGTALGCFLTNAEFQRGLVAGGPPAASPRLFAATVSNAAAGEVGIAYRLGGPSVTLTAGTASGGAALGHAADLLRAGRAEGLVAGGVDAFGDAVAEWIREGGAAPGRPISEGAGMVVLETLASARARGVPALATIEGYGAGFEPPPPSGDGLAAAVSGALMDADRVPSEVSLAVSGAPPALVTLERHVVDRALGGGAPRWMAPKDVLGETLGAAGPLGLLAALGEAAPGTILLVIDVCPTGHVAALVARAGEPT